MGEDAQELGERFGSGDGERKTLLTRQIAFEPLPASVLFALGGSVNVFMAVNGIQKRRYPENTAEPAP